MRCSRSQVSAFQHYSNIPLASSLSQSLDSSPRPTPPFRFQSVVPPPYYPMPPAPASPHPPPFISARAFWTRAGVKYVLSNTNTNTNTFFSGVSNTNTNTNTPAKIWSNTNTNTNTAHQIQIQIQIHNEAETKLPPFYRWHIEIYCIVRRLFIHSNFTENCFQRSNLQ